MYCTPFCTLFTDLSLKILVKVQNDILTSIDQHGVVILVMLDLSAAFDTIDHDILFSRMENTLGITGQALA